MDRIITASMLLIGMLVLVGFAVVGFASYKEGERRAMNISISLGVASSGVFFLATWLSMPIKLGFLGIIAVIIFGLLVLFVWPIGRVSMGNDTPWHRFDERDIMFARANLQPGSAEYEAYYAMRPENRESDERTRSKPGLYSPDSLYANEALFAPINASFGLIEILREVVNGPVSGKRCTLPVARMTEFVKGLAYYYGALDVGITVLEPYHVYSHIGRGSGIYGAPFDIVHSYALAFTVEMEFQMVGAGPKPPISMESSRQYVEAARTALQLAAAIRNLGYSARAHIDGNYRVIAPLVARDAGLGEIGRMELLMTPRQGPRVRLGVVTTDADLIPDERRPNPAVLDFCMICKKCAENCPSKSIPYGDRQEIKGALRWRINSDTCFRYWNTLGTDCGRCMAVCPYSHPDALSHNFVRWGTARSGYFRRAAVWLDDLFYGRKPALREAPKWANVS